MKDEARDFAEKLEKAIKDPATFESAAFDKIVEMGASSREEGLEREKKGIKRTIPEHLKTQIDKLHCRARIVLLAMTMESVRGYWGDCDERIAMIHYLCDNIIDEGIEKKVGAPRIRQMVPQALLNAIRHNVFLFDGEWTDGRIFRDGDRLHGLSGNLAYRLTGDDRIKQDGFYGTYYEVWAYAAYNTGGDYLLSLIKKVHEEVLSKTSDMTWENLNDWR